jgi:glycosyltransferase involved in cell wall biosynthesis
MRAAFVCSDPGIPVFGRKGASVHVQSVLRVLAQRGAEVHLIAARTGGAVPPGLESVHLHELPAVPAGAAPDRERAARGTDAAVAPVLAALADAGPLDLVYERYSLWGRTATAWAKDNTVPSVLEVNAPLVDEQASHRVLVDRAGAEAVAEATLSAADVVVCVSEPVAAWARSWSRRPERVAVVANGVDTDRVRPADRPVTPARAVPFTLGFVGTLKPWHGVETLLDALALLHRAEPGAYRLLLVGDGPQAAALQARAEAAGIAALVERTGSVDPVEIAPLLHRMDVAVAPYPETASYFSPLKVYEYLAAGLPVVASDVGQLPELLDRGRLGVLVEPGRADALAHAVADLRADEARRCLLRRATREATTDHHGWDRVVDRILSRLPAPQHSVTVCPVAI